MGRIVLAMSGGVDSSVAAHLLSRQGHEVIGVFMRHGAASPVTCSTVSGRSGGMYRPLPLARPHRQGCCSAADAADARRVADQLHIPFYALDFEAEFERIIDYFVDEYTRGRTPNPCVVCNHWLKFGKLFDYAESVGAHYVATGHYARLMPSSRASAPRRNRRASVRPVSRLCRGVDASKDQSYVLFGIDRRRLARMMLPIGGYCKTEIRRLAARFGINVASKPDSQEICFVTSGTYDQLVRHRRGTLDTSGEIMDTAGSVVGRHSGIERFTIGQRKGLGVAMGQPRYVVRIEADTRRVIIGSRDELAVDRVTAAGVNWLVTPPREPLRCDVQIRYHSRAVPATVTPQDDRLQVAFDQPCHGVAPGQAVVCYRGPQVLGGAWIDACWPVP